jgi:hypothetical protein
MGAVSTREPGGNAGSQSATPYYTGPAQRICPRSRDPAPPRAGPRATGQFLMPR